MKARIVRYTSRSLFLFTVGLCLTHAASAQSESKAPPSDVQTQIDELKARVAAQDLEIARLRQGDNEKWLTERRAEEIKLLVQDVLADADMRASLLQDSLTAGHDGKHFFLASANGDFRMNVGGYFQIRYILNHRDNSIEDDWEGGFQIRRAKIEFVGHIVSPKFIYSVQLAANRDSGVVEMDRAFVGYVHNEDLAVHAGRFKGPLLREEVLTSATRQLAVERSLVNAIFTANYVEGIKLEASAGGNLKFMASVNDGLRSGDPGGTGNDFLNDTTDFAVTLRGDAKLAGNWDQMRDFSAWNGEPTAVFVGGAIHYEVNETGDMQLAAPGVDSFLTYTIDGSFESGGFNAFAAFIGRHVDNVDTAALGSFDDLGLVLQGGYMVIANTLEPFIRYEWISPDDDRGFNDMNLITIGANYYIKKHSIKWTNDLIVALDELNAFAFAGSRTGLGILPDALGQKDQVVFRSQFQLVY